MTLQTLAVLGLAVAYGPRHAAASFGLYLALGALGLPVFAGAAQHGVGLAYMAGPTGGYLVGMLLACVITGVLGRHAGPLRRVLAMLAGTAVIFACGAAWLTHFVGSLQTAVQIGVLRFLPGELIKIALLTAFAAAGDEWLGRARRKAR
jgi:biotin transport system substrate-specific component